MNENYTYNPLIGRDSSPQSASYYQHIKGHGPVACAFDVTTNCNFNCMHCYNNSGSAKTDELTNAECIMMQSRLPI